MENDESKRWIDTGIWLVQANNLAEAGKYFAQAVKTNPASAAAWYWLGIAVDDVEKKQYCIQRALTIDPDIAHKINGPASRPSETAAPEEPAAPVEAEAPQAAPEAPAPSEPEPGPRKKVKPAAPKKRSGVRLWYVFLGVVAVLALVVAGIIIFMLYRGMLSF